MLVLMHDQLGRVLIATAYLVITRTLTAAVFRVERGRISRWL
jgi:hypothetical protein